MQYIYVAQLHANKVVSVSRLKRGITIAPNMVVLDTFDADLLGATYDESTQTFTKEDGE